MPLVYLGWALKGTTAGNWWQVPHVHLGRLIEDTTVGDRSTAVSNDAYLSRVVEDATVGNRERKHNSTRTSGLRQFLDTRYGLITTLKHVLLYVYEKANLNNLTRQFCIYFVSVSWEAGLVLNLKFETCKQSVLRICEQAEPLTCHFKAEAILFRGWISSGLVSFVQWGFGALARWMARSAGW